jgi:hypothetical protein
MIVSIVKNWDSPNILRQTPNCKGVWRGIKFVDRYDPFADVLVVLNENEKNLIGFHKRRVLLSQEPPHADYEYQKILYKNYDVVISFWSDFKESEFNPTTVKCTGLPWHVGYSYDQLMDLTYDKICKNKKLSWVTSNLNIRPGHEQRLALLIELRKNVEFDLYGRGFNEIKDKLDGLINYNYSIAFENFEIEDYWTEKITDCFLTYTIPLYTGCLNIQDYFDSESFVQLDFNSINKSIEIIVETIEKKPSDLMIQKLTKARLDVLNKYNFFNIIYDIIFSTDVAISKRKLKCLKKI